VALGAATISTIPAGLEVLQHRRMHK
jgi:hypothetical protein